MVTGLPVLNFPQFFFELRNFDGFWRFLEGVKEQIENFQQIRYHWYHINEIFMTITFSLKGFRAIWTKAKSLGSSFLEVVHY